MSVQRFIDADLGVAREIRSRLLSLLGLYGIRMAMSVLDDEQVELPGLVSCLLRQSRVDDLDAHIRAQFQGQADVFKTVSASRFLQRLGYRFQAQTEPEFMSAFRDEVRAIETSRAMHRLAEMEALGALPAAEQIDPEMRDEAVALFLSRAERKSDGQEMPAPDTLPSSRQLRERLIAWHRLENDPASDYMTRTICRVVRLSLMHLLGDAVGET
jgi:RNase P/RNase MRP subunit POP5